MLEYTPESHTNAGDLPNLSFSTSFTVTASS